MLSSIDQRPGSKTLNSAMEVLFFKARFFKSIMFFFKSLALFNFSKKRSRFDSFFCGESLEMPRLQLYSHLGNAMPRLDFFYRTSLSFYFFSPFFLKPMSSAVSAVKFYFRCTDSLAINGIQKRVLFVPPSDSLAVALFFVKI